MTSVEIETPAGVARAHLHPAQSPRAALVLGHGASAGVESRDLVAVTESAQAQGVSVALVEQPYRVAGRRSPAPAKRLDEAWVSVVEQLHGDQLRGLALIAGGRSLGARVACRCVEETGALAVLCIAFPLQPRGRSGGDPPPSRLSELEAVKVPVLIVQGDRDPFGMPPAGADRTVVAVPGTHGPSGDLEAVAAAAGEWLSIVVGHADNVPTG